MRWWQWNKWLISRRYWILYDLSKAPFYSKVHKEDGYICAIQNWSGRALMRSWCSSPRWVWVQSKQTLFSCWWSGGYSGVLRLAYLSDWIGWKCGKSQDRKNQIKILLISILYYSRNSIWVIRLICLLLSQIDHIWMVTSFWHLRLSENM